jgi:hypothetical protein
MSDPSPKIILLAVLVGDVVMMSSSVVILFQGSLKRLESCFFQGAFSTLEIRFLFFETNFVKVLIPLGGVSCVISLLVTHFSRSSELDTGYIPVTAVINPLITFPVPPLTMALIRQAHAQIPTRAAMVSPVPSANLEVSYPMLVWVSLLTSVLVFMMFSFMLLVIYLILLPFHFPLPLLKHL